MEEKIEATEIIIEAIDADNRVTEVEIVEVEIDIEDKRSEITIFIDRNKYEVVKREMTGAQLKALGHIPEANLLFLELRGPGDDELIQNTTEVQLHDGDCFYDMPPGNFGEM